MRNAFQGRDLTLNRAPMITVTGAFGWRSHPNADRRFTEPLPRSPAI